MIQLMPLGRPTDAPPLYAVPGLDGTIGSIEPVVKQLAETREVIVVDFSAETNETLEELVAEIAAAIKADLTVRGSPQIDITGQSIGTILAAQLASSHELPVRKVVLTCTFTHLRWNVLRLAVFFTRYSPNFLYRLTSPLTISLSCGPVGDGRDHPAFAATRDSDQRAAARRTAWQIGRDFSADLVKIHSPLLVLMGAEDRFVPNAKKEIAKLRALFADHPARVGVIPHAGHILLPSAAINTAVREIEEFLG